MTAAVTLGVALADLFRMYQIGGPIIAVRADARDGVCEIDTLIYDQDGLNVLTCDGEFVISTLELPLSTMPG